MTKEALKQEQYEPKCKTHPDAPHGFVRNASHSEDRYVCECEFWEPPEQDEPVGEAYLCDCCLTPFDGAYECPSCGHNSSTKEPVYTTPQQRKPLTNQQIDEIYFDSNLDIDR